MMVKSFNTNKQIVVSNQINEARFKMSRAEQKLFLYCIGAVDNQEDKLTTKFEMSVKDFAAFLELKSNKVYDEMIKTTGDMASRVIQFAKPDGDIHQIPVLAEVRYRKGLVRIEVNRNLAPYLIDLKSHFTKYSLQEVLSFKSVYSMRIYQILCQWGYQEHVRYSIEELRFMLNIEPEEYKLYGDFKRYVLEVASKEINKSSSLKFTYKEIKTGRKVTDINFLIKKPVKPKEDTSNTVKTGIIVEQELIPKTTASEQPNLTENIQQNLEQKAARHLPYYVGEEKTPNLSEKYMFVEKRLIALGFSSSKAVELIQNHGLDYLEFVLEKSKIETRSKVDNKAGYLQVLLSTYKTTFEEHIEQEKRQKEDLRLSQERKEEIERIEREAEEKFYQEQEELSRDILEQEPELFCKAVYHYLKLFVVDLPTTGYMHQPDYQENRKNNNHQENLKLAREIRNKFLACSDLREFRTILKYDEDWLFKAVFNDRRQFDPDSIDYYKSKQIIQRLSKVELPFNI